MSRESIQQPQSPQYCYQVGGSLPYDAPSYVKRQADHDFYRALSSGEFCYVLNSRQMGKSSLRVQTMKRLEADGHLCLSIDISGFGTQSITPEQWYGGMINALVFGAQLNHTFNWRTWWREQKEFLTPVQRLGLFIEQILLRQVHGPITIFIDEIDQILSQGVSGDDFLALIRYFYNQRVDQKNFERLTFSLLGVVTPSALMTDQATTAFNIGVAIPLHGFQRSEVYPLQTGLIGSVSDPSQVIAKILDWTDGQPFLTQKLCSLVLEEVSENSLTSVDDVVKKRILDDWESQDEPIHFRTLRDRILRSQRPIQLLTLYRQVRENNGMIAHQNAMETELRLSGLVSHSEGHLKVFNQIYGEIFNLSWIQAELRNIRPYASALDHWIESNQNSKYLLKGSELSKILAWEMGKNLSEQDYKFIISSKSRSDQLQKTKNRLKQIGLGISLMAIASLFTIGVITYRRSHNQTIRNRIDVLTQKGMQDLDAKRFNSALTRALEANQDLQALTGKRPITDYPTTAPMLLLNQVLEHYQAELTQSSTSTQRTSNPIGEESIWALDLHPNGNQMAIAGVGHTIQLWNTSTNTQEATLCHGNVGTIISMDFSPSQNQLITASFDAGNLRLWDLNSPLSKQCQTSETNPIFKEWNAQQQSILQVLFSPRGDFVASAGWDGSTNLWTLKGDPLSAGAKPHDGPTRAINFSQDQAYLATGGEDGQIHVSHLCQPYTRCTQQNVSVSPKQTWVAHRGWVWSLAFHPQVKEIISVGEDGIIRLWGLDGKELIAHESHQGRLTQVLFNREGSLIATAGWKGTVKLWALSRKKRTLMAIASWDSAKTITTMTFSPDGRYLFTGDVTGTVKKWPIYSLSELIEVGQKLSQSSGSGRDIIDTVQPLQ